LGKKEGSAKRGKGIGGKKANGHAEGRMTPETGVGRFKESAGGKNKSGLEDIARNDKENRTSNNT